MKNLITKFSHYKDIGPFNNVYFLNSEYTFNEKGIQDIINFVNDEPFCPVMIHSNDINGGIVNIIKETSKLKEVWFQTDKILFEDLAVLDKDTLTVLGIDKIDVMIDALGDIIDMKKSLQQNSFIRFNYMKVPF